MLSSCVKPLANTAVERQSNCRRKSEIHLGRKEVKMTQTKEVMRKVRDATTATESRNQGSVQLMGRHARKVEGRTITHKCTRQLHSVHGKSTLIIMALPSQSTHSEMSK
ncbi:hypothetical protein SK128_000266 [Halocaridina rubra]|uniref:Uncharacterized protein n=1 Tax=Halocaridina rubra TaxID=373956 RepID=A0AAN8XGK8_HALRR